MLQQSVTERIERETAIFDLARDNLDVFTKEFLRLYFEGDEGAHRMEREFSDGVSSRTRTDFWPGSVRRSRRGLLALMREVSAGGGTFSLMASRPQFVVTIGSAAMAAKT